MILVDFDGTIAEHRYPHIGDPMPMAFEVLRALKKAGCKLILWTCREDDGHNINRRFLTDAVNFCKENGVEFDAVNETIEGEDFRSKTQLKRKPYAHYQIDDSIIGGFPGWAAIAEYLGVEVEAAA
jgi:hypothetical protein